MDEKIIIQEKADKKALLAPLLLLVLFVVVYFCCYWTVDWLRDFSLVIAIPICFICCIIVWWMEKCEITVTTHRVYGRTRTKQVDLPLDSISATAKGMFRSVIVSTSSGRITFWLLKNQNEIFDAISALLRERQRRPVETGAEKRKTSAADTLKEYKSLLDAGIITQEEFDAKKKQILGL